MDRTRHRIAKRVLVYISALVISLSVVIPMTTETAHAGTMTLERTHDGNAVAFKSTNVPGFEGKTFKGTCADVTKHSVASTRATYWFLSNSSLQARIAWYYQGWLSSGSGNPSPRQRLKEMMQYANNGESAFYSHHKNKHGKNAADKTLKRVKGDINKIPWDLYIPDSFVVIYVKPDKSSSQPGVLWYDRGYGQVTIVKTSTDSSTLTASGWNLQGAVIRVYCADRTTVRATMTVGSKTGGSQTFYNLIAGETYYIHESSIPGNSGYNMDTGWYPVTVGKGGSATVTLKNPPKVSYAKVKKVASPANAMNQGGYSLKGITFDIYRNDGTKINTKPLVTDETGVTETIRVPSGTYYAMEVGVPEDTGFIKNTGQSTPVTIGEGKTGIIQMTNAAKLGTITIQKELTADSTPGGSVEGFSFTIQNTKSGDTYTATTNANGVATFNNIPLGTYKVKEVMTKAQDKLYEDKIKSKKITLSTSQVNVSIPSWKNKYDATGKVEVHKTMVGDVAGDSPKGFSFKLTGITIPGLEYYAKTDADGIARFDKIPIGQYSLTELMSDTQEPHYTDLTEEKIVTVKFDKTTTLSGTKAWQNGGNNPDGFYIVLKKSSLGVDANPEDKFKFVVNLNWDTTAGLTPKYSIYSENKYNDRNYVKKNVEAGNIINATLKDGYCMKIGPFPEGATYSITEGKSADYIPAYEVTELEGTVDKKSDTGEVNRALTASGELTNVRGTYKVTYDWTNTAASNQYINQLEVEKAVSDGSNTSFNFAANLSGLSPNEYYAKVVRGNNSYGLYVDGGVVNVIDSVDKNEGSPVAGVPLTLERVDGKTKVFRTNADGQVDLTDPDIVEWAAKTGGDITIHWLGDDFTCNIYGAAYAVLDDSGNLVMFRSKDTYTNDTTGTFTDVDGNTYTGRVFAGIETTDAADSTNCKWYSYRASIKTASIADGQTIKPINTAYWFSACTKMTDCDLEGLDTSKVTNMKRMFSACYVLPNLDVTGLDTSNVTDMNYMFNSCNSLTSLDLSNFDTSGVANMDAMFCDCVVLTSLDLSSFNTSNVTDMDWMFYNCSNLTSLDLSRFDTSNVTSMSYMFSDCSNLTSLDLSNFDTSSVANMGYMFNSCRNLTSLDLSSFDTDNVVSMQAMFGGCLALTTIYVSNKWDASSVTATGAMFTNCTNLVGEKGTTYDSSIVNKTRAIVDDAPDNPGYLTYRPGKKGDAYAVLDDEGNLIFFRSKDIYTNDTTGTFTDIKGRTYTGRVFAGIETTNATNSTNCKWYSYRTSIRTVRVADGQIIKPINTAYWFYGCSNMTDCDLDGFDTSGVTDMSYMFSGCYSLTSLDVTGFDTSNVTNMGYMFYNCDDLTSLDVTGFDTSNVTTMSSMFCSCNNLTSLDVTGFDTSNITSMYSMFGYCSKLTNLDLSDFDTSNVTNIRYMFVFCSSLTTIYVSNTWDVSGVTASESMFSGCTNLVGEKGTTYDSSIVNKTRAIIDNAPTTPGYLTTGPAPSLQTQSLPLEDRGNAEEQVENEQEQGEDKQTEEETLPADEMLDVQDQKPEGKLNRLKAFFEKGFKTEHSFAVPDENCDAYARGYDITSFQTDANGNATVPFTLAAGDEVFIIGMDESSKYTITEMENKYSPSYVVNRTDYDGSTERLLKGSGDAGADFTTKEGQFPESGKTIDRASFMNAIDTSHLIVTKESTLEEDDTDFGFTVNMNNLRDQDYLIAFPGNATATLETTSNGNIQVTITNSTYFSGGDYSGIPVRIIRPDGDARTYYTDAAGQIDASLYENWLKEGLEEPFNYKIDFLNQIIHGTYGG